MTTSSVPVSTRRTLLRSALSWAVTIGVALGVWWMVTTLGLTVGVVRSGSMEPTFARRDSVLAIGTNIRAPQMNDVVIATPTLGNDVLPPTVHRIVGRVDRGWVTQGDANPSVDPWYLTDSDIQAVVLRSIPTSKLTVSPLMLALVLGVAAMFILWPRSKDPDDTQTDEDAQAAADTPALTPSTGT